MGGRQDCCCPMMIECVVKTGQTVESIEHIRRERGQFVGIQASNGRWLKGGCLCNKWKEKGKTVEFIEHIRMEGGDAVGGK